VQVLVGRNRRITAVVSDDDAVVCNSHYRAYAQLDDGDFYRGVAEDGENGSALIFC